jgi:DNA-binding NarL/FixJ family response regulator
MGAVFHPHPNGVGVYHILVADDYANFRKIVRNLLGEMSLPCSVAEAEDGPQALALGLEQPWDLVILDINMPGLSGLKVLDRLKRARPDLVVLIVSMNAGRGYIQYCLSAGASGYLAKESAPAELEAAVQTVLAGETYVSRRLIDDQAAG